MEQNKKGFRNNLSRFLSTDPAWKYISLLLIIIGLFAAIIGFIALFVYVMSFVGQGLDIATYNMERKTGINIWNYITPFFIYGILATLYYFVFKYLKKYNHYTICKISIGLLSVGVALLLYNAFLTGYIVTVTQQSRYLLHLLQDGRALFNIDNPIGVIAVHILVFLLPGLVVSALVIPENNYD